MLFKKEGNLRDRVLFALVSKTFFSPQSAMILSISFILFAFSFTPFDWWQSIFWLAFGLLGEAAYIGATITDPSTHKSALEMLLREEYDPDRIKNPAARERIRKALEYYSAIEVLVDTRTGASKLEFQDALENLDDWIEHIYDLAIRIDTFDNNQIINGDHMASRIELEILEEKLKTELDKSVKQELERAITLKENQIKNLNALEESMRTADIHMDNTLSSIGTVYAQLLNIIAKGIDSGSAKRLHNQIHDQVLELQDTIAAIDEVQASSF